MKQNNFKNTITFNKVRDFNPDHIFDCGQCFRWERQEDGSYLGAAGSFEARISYNAKANEVTVETNHNDRNFWYSYLDLGRDYGKIKDYLASKDSVMTDAITYGEGIRILNQDPWEAVISFIISQNNNIPRIKKCINSLIALFDGRLPGPDQLAACTVEDLAPCRLGYRARYLVETGRQMTEDPGCLARLKNPEVSATEAAAELRKFTGIGPKVADCIALFGLGKVDSFPVDVWVKRVMNELYDIPEKNVSEMHRYAREHFAPYGGIAQQYLFYYITHRNYT